MTIEFKDGRYFKAIFHFEFRATAAVAPDPPLDGNYLAALYTDDPNRNDWTLVYRFRYYVDNKTGTDSEDIKSWYSAHLLADEETAFRKTSDVIGLMCREESSKLNVTLVESSDANVQMDKLKSSPYMHTSMLN